MLDSQLFCCMFQRHLVVAANQFGRYKGIGPEARFQNFLAVQLGAFGNVAIEEMRFKELLGPGCGSSEYLPRHMAGVDLSLAGTVDDPAQFLGFELKIFSNDYQNSSEYRNVEYFVTGEYSESSCYTGSNGTFLQAGHSTFCKEGQLLQDFCRAARILAKQEVDGFILAGLLRYDISKVDAALLQKRLENLLALPPLQKEVAVWCRAVDGVRTPDS
ncbi:MAG: hypothetical protein B6I36_10945 [Desulfobacteraceae bacterium 4572_35.1]|nr:MAG: hypothetical protein B6I36_10945 [Desulfobacteraceae bacterium 4572_35.1]